MLALVVTAWLAGTAAAEVRHEGPLETLDALGWSDSCSVAVRHLRYPAVTEGITDEPAWGRIGLVRLAPDERNPKQEWMLEYGGKLVWDKKQADTAEDQLKRSGHGRTGYTETVRADPAAGSRPDLDPLIRGVGSLGVNYPVQWPAPPFRLSRVLYSPLGLCAFIVFERPDARLDIFRYTLVRVPVEARRKRAQAHLDNALVLYRDESDIYGALDEAAIAATMDPRLADARYEHAVLLGAHGRFDEALPELRAAVELDRRYVKEAKKASEFEDLKKDQRFRAIAR